MGSLTPGKLADFVVLDQDIMVVPAPDILGTQCSRRILEEGRCTNAVGRVPPRISRVCEHGSTDRRARPCGRGGQRTICWLSPDRLTRVRAVLLGLTLFFGLAVYVFHTIGAAHLAQATLVGSCADSA